jgi:ribosomal protein S6
MYGSQIERLKKDSKELKHYIQKIEKTGNSQLAYKLQKKHEYLNSRIEDIKEELGAA